MKKFYVVLLVVAMGLVGAIVSWGFNLPTIDSGIFAKPWFPEGSHYTTDYKVWRAFTNSPYRHEVSLNEFKADFQSAETLAYVFPQSPHPIYAVKYGKMTVVCNDRSLPRPIFLLVKEAKYWGNGEFHWVLEGRAWWYYVIGGAFVGALAAWVTIRVYRSFSVLISLAKNETKMLLGREVPE